MNLTALGAAAVFTFCAAQALPAYSEDALPEELATYVAKADGFDHGQVACERAIDVKFATHLNSIQAHDGDHTQSEPLAPRSLWDIIKAVPKPRSKTKFEPTWPEETRNVQLSWQDSRELSQIRQDLPTTKEVPDGPLYAARHRVTRDSEILRKMNGMKLKKLGKAVVDTKVVRGLRYAVYKVDKTRPGFLGPKKTGEEYHSLKETRPLELWWPYPNLERNLGTIRAAKDRRRVSPEPIEAQVRQG